jgi:cytochrome b subunit of formate dehydrogenase
VELFREATNPWGMSILIGVSWTLIWAAVIAGALFMIAHAIYVWRGGEPGRGATTGGLSGGRSSPAEAGAGAGLPEKIVRHSVAARVFHWAMAAAMLALLVTAFFPILDVRFDWVPIHYWAGLVLIGAIVYHVIHATFWQSLWNMWIGTADVREGVRMAREVVGKREEHVEKAGKYPVDHKLYHNIVTVVAIAAMVTGVLMMFRVDTPFWQRSLYIFSDQGWGRVYVIHGLAGIGLITLVMTHVYFAVRPEKWWITRSMFKGWITRREFLEHHDPHRWNVGASGPDGMPAAPNEPELVSVGADSGREPRHTL